MTSLHREFAGEGESSLAAHHKVGDDIEVQWGASIDEGLGEQVRVTVIATGYKVDGLPSEDEEEGKKTISEAIEANYPQQAAKQPMEDESPAMIDLSETLFAQGAVTPQQLRERAASTSADEVLITVEEESKEEEPEAEPEAPRSRFGWIRRK